ncbi:YodC family protein [Mesorhizobium sp. A623]
MADSFKPGDVVRLKSGGPQMTVSDASAASGAVMCNWFNREGDVWTPQHAGFKSDQLVAATAPAA